MIGKYIDETFGLANYHFQCNVRGLNLAHHHAAQCPISIPQGFIDTRGP